MIKNKCIISDSLIKKKKNEGREDCCVKYSGIIKKNERMSFVATGMHPEIIRLTEVSQRDKHHMISLTCDILKKNDTMNLFTKQKHTHRKQKNFRLPKGKRGKD